MVNPIRPGNGGNVGRVPGADLSITPASKPTFDPLHALKLAAMDQRLGETQDWAEAMALKLDMVDSSSLHRLSPRDRVSLSHVARCSKKAAKQLVGERLITPSQLFHCTSIIENSTQDRSWLSLYWRPLHGLLRIATIHYAALLASRGEEVTLGYPINIEKSWLPDVLWNELEQTPGFPYGDVDSAFEDHLEHTSFDVQTRKAGIMVFWGARSNIFDVSRAQFARYGAMQRLRISQSLAIAGRFNIPWIDIVLYGGSMFDEQWFARIASAARMMNVRMSVTSIPVPITGLRLPEETMRRILFETPPRSKETFAAYLKRSARAGGEYEEWVSALKEARFYHDELAMPLRDRVIDGVRVLQLPDVLSQLFGDSKSYAVRDVLPHVHAVLRWKLNDVLRTFQFEEFGARIEELQRRIVDSKDVVANIWRKQLRKAFAKDMQKSYALVQKLEALVHPDYRGTMALMLAGDEQDSVVPHGALPITDLFMSVIAQRARELTNELPIEVVVSPGNLPALEVEL